MANLSYSRLNEKEPAALAGVLASVLGFFGLFAADVDAVQAFATAFGMAGTQSILTRQSVYSSDALGQLGAPEESGQFSKLMDWRPGAARQREPTVAIGAGVLVAGFLTQFFAGVGLIEALTSATGVAGVQATATRGQVYSPASARGAAIATAISSEFSPEEGLDALQKARLLPR